MKILKIQYHNDLIIIGSPSHKDSFCVSVLLDHLYFLWKSNQFNTDLIRESPIINKILNFLPRLDLPKQNDSYIFGINEIIIKEFDNGFIESVFLRNINQNKEDKFADCEIKKLLDVDTSQHKIRKKDNTIPESPISTSGNEEADLLVALTLYFNNSFKDAELLYNNYDSQFIYDFIYQFGEMNKDPKEKELEFRAEVFDQWKKKNQSTYNSYLGI